MSISFLLLLFENNINTKLSSFFFLNLIFIIIKFSLFLSLIVIITNEIKFHHLQHLRIYFYLLLQQLYYLNGFSFLFYFF
jgi:hypothetical protein